MFQARFGGLSFGPGGFERTCYLFTPRRCRRIYIQDMAKKVIQKIIEKDFVESPSDVQKGSCVHMVDHDDFKEIVKETLKAQEASLNAMKMLSKSIFSYDLSDF